MMMATRMRMLVIVGCTAKHAIGDIVIVVVIVGIALGSTSLTIAEVNE